MFQGIGCVKAFQHKCKMLPNSYPVHKCKMLPNSYPVVHKQRPIPFAFIPQVQAEADKLLPERIIEKVDY